MSGSPAKSVLATLVGWAIVGLLLFWFLGIVVGTIRFMIRFIVWIVLLGLLVAAYMKLKEPSD
jgi:hypothetical protein